MGAGRTHRVSHIGHAADAAAIGVAELGDGLKRRHRNFINGGGDFPVQGTIAAEQESLLVLRTTGFDGGAAILHRDKSELQGVPALRCGIDEITGCHLEGGSRVGHRAALGEGFDGGLRPDAEDGERAGLGVGADRGAVRLKNTQRNERRGSRGLETPRGMTAAR